MTISTKKSRRPQLQRVGKKDRRPFVPGPREEAILEFLNFIGWANQEHISKVFFPPKILTEIELAQGKVQKYYQLDSAQATRRLDGLFHDEGSVERKKPYSKYGISLEPIAHFIRGRDPNLNSQNYWHEKLARDIITDIMRACDIYGIRIIDSKTSPMLQSIYPFYIADHYFLLFFNNRLLDLFIEIDRGKEEHDFWFEKVQATIDFLNSEIYKTYYKDGRAELAQRLGATARGVIVATVTTGKQRMENMVETTIRAGGKRRFWFSTFDQSNPETVLTQDIWKIATVEGLHHLTE